MYYKVKRVSFKKDGLYVTVAASNIRPLQYYTAKFNADPQSAPIREFLESVANGNFQPLPSCTIQKRSLYAIANEMESLRSYAPSISIRDDMLCGCSYSSKLSAALGEIAATWLLNGVIKASKQDIEAIRRLNQEAKDAYRLCKQKMEDDGIITVDAAQRSDVFEGYNVLAQSEGNMFLGKRERYDNRGHYDNSDGSAIFLARSDTHMASLFFRFFGSGYWPKDEDKPEINWEPLMGIPGWKAVKRLYEII